MPAIHQGSVLTCTHAECDCRVVIERVCTCDGVTEDSVYTCACGAPLVPVAGE